MMSPVRAGSKALEFDSPVAGGGRVSSASLSGSPYVLYFYPKDDTPGCTREAVDFTERAAAFAAIGVAVIGVSKDSVEKHDKFVAKHRLKLILISDAEGDLSERYGVWGEKTLYGKTYLGLERATFLIDAEGVVAEAWRKVKVPGHVDAVLDSARRLLSTNT